MTRTIIIIKVFKKLIPDTFQEVRVEGKIKRWREQNGTYQFALIMIHSYCHDDQRTNEHMLKKSNLGGHKAGSDDNCLHVAAGLGFALHYLKTKNIMLFELQYTFLIIMIIKITIISQFPQHTCYWM